LRSSAPASVRKGVVASAVPPVLDVIHQGQAESSPIPGAGRPVRGIFVSRDGGLLLADPAKWRSRNGIACATRALRLLFRAGQRGWNLYLIGNEDDVAKGRVADEAWEEYEARLRSKLAGEGIVLVRHYACLDHPKGKGKHRRDSVFRFPNTGALFHAAQEDGIELRESWLLSSDVDELAAGWRAGCRTGCVGSAKGGERTSDLEVEADLVAEDLASALEELLACDEYSRA
jgi:histidinol phosphatase-like enzyme